MKRPRKPPPQRRVWFLRPTRRTDMRRRRPANALAWSSAALAWALLSLGGAYTQASPDVPEVPLVAIDGAEDDALAVMTPPVDTDAFGTDDTDLTQTFAKKMRKCLRSVFRVLMGGGAAVPDTPPLPVRLPRRPRLPGKRPPRSIDPIRS